MDYGNKQRNEYFEYHSDQIRGIVLAAENPEKLRKICENLKKIHDIAEAKANFYENEKGQKRLDIDG